MASFDKMYRQVLICMLKDQTIKYVHVYTVEFSNYMYINALALARISVNRHDLLYKLHCPC